jgi:hypothetical protein
VIDDHTRLAYVEIHRHDRGDRRCPRSGRCVDARRRLRASPGRDERQRVRLHQSNAFTAALSTLDARSIRIPPRTPRWNGKAERFIRALDEEWAHSRV